MRVQGGHPGQPGQTEPPRARARARDGGAGDEDFFTLGEPEL